jgi:hypothetical protein
MRCFCLKSNFFVYARLEVEDRPEQEQRSRLPKSIAYVDRQEKRVGKAGKQRQPDARATWTARAGPAELLGGHRAVRLVTIYRRRRRDVVPIA